MKKLQLKRKKKEVALPPRITNETVAEHRERILAGGRRFKYPIQYSRHRLVINTILISMAALLLAALVVWHQLYIAQNSSNLFYRLTRIVPLPVASVEGESVRYSDYLMRYRSSLHYLEGMKQIDLSKREGRNQAESIKSLAMNSAVADAYAQKIAEERSISIDQKRVDEFEKLSQAGLSQDAYESVTQDVFNWTPEEARHIIRQTLLRQDVAFAVDENAANLKRQVTEAIASGKSLEQISKDMGQSVMYADQGFISKENEDGGLTDAAIKLEKGKTSEVVRTSAGDGYYFVHHIESNEEQIHYAYLKIPLTKFENDLKKLREANKVDYHIKINPASTATTPVPNSRGE